MERVLGLTAHFSKPIAITVTPVTKPVYDLVPELSDLIEDFGVWLLALVCKRKCVLDHYPVIKLATYENLTYVCVNPESPSISQKISKYFKDLQDTVRLM